VVGGRLYIGSADGTVYALNASSGCIYWTYKANGGVRTGTIISPNGGTGPSIAGGVVYASAGYARFPVMGGDVLLAFSVNGK
jgi:outer membrane protein assembly factor BamB